MKYCAATSAATNSATATAAPAGFTAGAPAAVTSSVSITGAGTATVRGSVNPSGQSTTYKALYALASDPWCTSHGASGTPSSASGGTLTADTSFHAVTVNLTGLTAGSKYCVAISATNSSTATATQLTFTA